MDEKQVNYMRKTNWDVAISTDCIEINFGKIIKKVFATNRCFNSHG